MDAAKIAWLLYEHPEKLSLKRISMTFMDIRKRIYKFPELGKGIFVAIPTTSGTGSEVTPLQL